MPYFGKSKSIGCSCDICVVPSMVRSPQQSHRKTDISLILYHGRKFSDLFQSLYIKSNSIVF